MVYAGEEPRFIFRRLLISAAEDVGLADPAAIGVVESCAAAYERIGLPEGQFHLAQAALYLATAPKSNSSMGYFDALAAIEKERAEVPNHLKDASRDADGFGHGQGYQYPHAYRGHWTAQQYLPDALRGAVFYRPGAQGYEAGIRDEVLRRRDAQLAAYLAGEDGQEGGMRGESAWNARVSAGAAFALVRDELMAALDLQRHENILILNGDDGLLAREASRVCTDGSLTLLVREEAALERLGYAYSDTEELLRPAMARCQSLSRTGRLRAGRGGPRLL
jgi:putative ATPase